MTTESEEIQGAPVTAEQVAEAVAEPPKKDDIQQRLGDRAKCDRLRMQVLKSISDPELHKFVSQLPDDDQTWLFFALIASAAQTREGQAISHMRDLINNQVLAAPKPEIHLDIKGEVTPLVAPIEKRLMQMDEILKVLSESEGDHANDNLRNLKKIKEEFQGLKDEVAESLNKTTLNQKKFVNEIEAVAVAVAGLTKTVNSMSSNAQKPNYLLIGIGLVCAMAFGLMTGITASRGLSSSDIQHIIQQTAVEAAAQMQAQSTTPRR
jgi:hypothetical protein